MGWRKKNTSVLLLPFSPERIKSHIRLWPSGKATKQRSKIDATKGACICYSSYILFPSLFLWIQATFEILRFEFEMREYAINLCPDNVDWSNILYAYSLQHRCSLHNLTPFFGPFSLRKAIKKTIPFIGAAIIKMIKKRKTSWNSVKMKKKCPLADSLPGFVSPAFDQRKSERKVMRMWVVEVHTGNIHFC